MISRKYKKTNKARQKKIHTSWDPRALPLYKDGSMHLYDVELW